MDSQTADKIIQATHRVRAFAAFALLMLGIFLVVGTVSELKSIGYIGAGIAPTNTIAVDGEGDVFAVPDTAQFSFTVSDTEKDVTTAQNNASQTENTIVDYLKAQGVADTDIQTTDYEVNPQYSYQQAACPVTPMPLEGGGAVPDIAYCPPGKQTLTGYQVSETVSVKVTDTTKAGTLLSAIGSKGATDISGLSFVVSNEDALQDQARGKAIADAQGKAQTLAQQLGVHLVRLVGYSENNNGLPYAPMAMAMNASTSGGASSAPELPTGQNKITEDVTLTYEIQ